MPKINTEKFLAFLEEEMRALEKCRDTSAAKHDYQGAAMCQEDLSCYRMILCMITGEDDIIPVGEFMEGEEDEADRENPMD